MDTSDLMVRFENITLEAPDNSHTYPIPSKTKLSKRARRKYNREQAALRGRNVVLYQNQNSSDDKDFEFLSVDLVLAYKKPTLDSQKQIKKEIARIKTLPMKCIVTVVSFIATDYIIEKIRKSKEIPPFLSLDKYADEIVHLDLGFEWLDFSKTNKILRLFRNIVSLRLSPATDNWRHSINSSGRSYFESYMPEEVVELGQNIINLEKLQYLDASVKRESDLKSVMTDDVLCNLKSKKAIRYLDMSGNRWPLFRGFRELSEYTNMQHLGLSRCSSLTDYCLEYISNLVHLVFLDISYCHLTTDRGLSYIKCQKLTHLDVSGLEQISDKGVTGLTKLKNVNYFALKVCCKITGRALDAIATMSKLQNLDLEGCYKIDDAGVSSLERCIELRSLNLHGCKLVTDIALESISRLSDLEKLDISFCRVVEENALQTLHGSRKLKFLRIAGISASENSIHDLKRDIPGINILTSAF